MVSVGLDTQRGGSNSLSGRDLFLPELTNLFVISRSAVQIRSLALSVKTFSPNNIENLSGAQDYGLPSGICCPPQNPVFRFTAAGGGKGRRTDAIPLVGLSAESNNPEGQSQPTLPGSIPGPAAENNLHFLDVVLVSRAGCGSTPCPPRDWGTM